MRSTTGFRRSGLLAILAAILLPASGIGIAAADLSVGDQIQLRVPDLEQVPDLVPPKTQFTCRAVTEHAYWLVQDTTYYDTEDPILLWPDYFGQEELDSLTEQFEGGGVDVYGTITSQLAQPQPTVNDDDKLYIMFCEIPDKYDAGASGIVRTYPPWTVWPVDYDGVSETGNNHDCLYINIGWYRDYAAVFADQVAYTHMISIPSALTQFVRYTYNLDEHPWLGRALGLVGQYTAYGYTNMSAGASSYFTGIGKYIDLFMTRPQKQDLDNLASGSFGTGRYFCGNTGGAFLMLMYAQQRTSDDILPSLVTSDFTSMTNVGMAISPSADSSTVVDETVIPIWNDFIITAAVTDYAADFEGGKYHFDFLDGTGQVMDIPYQTAPLDGDITGYPFGTFLVPAMKSPAWSVRYFGFLPDTTGGGPQGTVYFNGQYNQNNGSGANYNGKWSVFKLVLEDSTLVAVDEVDLSELYNGSFDLAGDRCLAVSTNNNVGGQPDLASVFSQDTANRQLLLALMQSPANSQYIQAFSSLYLSADWMPYGMDWVGPRLTATKGDSTQMADMELFSGTIWRATVGLWEEGNYDISCIGYDSLGVGHTKSFEVSCAYSEQEGKALNLTDARLDIPAGATAPGEMAVIMETDMLGMSLESQIPISGTAEAMTGVLAGPVSVSDVNTGTISFTAADNSGAVYRWSAEQWEKLEGSYYQSGRMHATIDEGGIYVYGESPGVVSPTVPAQLALNGSYPNPFVAQAAISYSLPEAGRATLKVFDLSGRLIRTLADGDMAAADHTVVWDGRDASGNEVGAGVYFCRLEAAGHTATQKMLRIE